MSTTKGLGTCQLDVLDSMANDEPWTIEGLGKDTGRARSSVHRAIHALVARGLVESAGTRPRDNSCGGRPAEQLWALLK